MSREIKRVPVDFDWPLNKIWSGYQMPDSLSEDKCPDCTHGFSVYGEYLHAMWYGNVPFDPRSTGSVAFEPVSPGVRAFAERNIGNAPEFYGRGEQAIQKEARRLAVHFNSGWMHHLSPADVAALAERGRLRDFTHTWVKGEGWQPKVPAHMPTAAEVNEWSLRGMGHDSINALICVEARCVREGLPYRCATCDGHAAVEKYDGQRAEAEAWESTEPPEGDGYQLWESVSEGSPISPVFPDREGIIAFLMSEANSWGTSRPLTRSQAEAFVGAGSSIGSFVVSNGELINGDAAVEALGGRP